MDNNAIISKMQLYFSFYNIIYSNIKLLLIDNINLDFFVHILKKLE